MSNQYVFSVPNIGTIRVKAKALDEALMEVADAAGIKMLSVSTLPQKAKPRVVRPSIKQISHN